MKMKDLFEGGDWEKEITKRVKAKLPDQSKITKGKPQSSTTKDYRGPSFYDRGFEAGYTGIEAPGDSTAISPSKEYQRGFEAGKAARKKEASKKKKGMAEGGFFDPDQPNPGDIVKHRNGAVGKVKKIGTQDDETWVYFKGEDGDMYFGQWKKSVFPMNKAESVEENFSGAVAGIAMPMGDMQTRNGPKKKRRSKKK